MPAPPSYADLAGLGALKGTVRPALGALRDYAVGLLGATGNVPDALAALGALVAGHVTLAATTTLTSAHRGRVIDCTGTITINLPAAASAGNGFGFVIRNAGSGVVTIDPAGSEMIDAATTIALPARRAALIVCTGGTWHSFFLPGTVQGAITQSATDATVGRLLKTGDFGLGGNAPIIGNAAVTDNSIAPGLYAYASGSGSSGGPTAVTLGALLHIRRTAGGGEAQLFFVEAHTGGPTVGETWSRVRTSGSWTAWNRQFGYRNILGTVSQTSGVPTGGLIERGSNGNGEYARFADGLQICTRTNLAFANASTAVGSLFRSADVSWTFPAAFIAAPAVSGEVDDVDCLLSAGAPTTTAVSIRALAALTKAAALNGRAIAVGRWF
jgi:hypothetical protein